VTMMKHGVQLLPGAQLPAAGSWRVDPARSHVSFAARAAGRQVQGRLPLTGRVLIAEPVEDSRALLAAAARHVRTGSHLLDRQVAGPGFLDAASFPEISFRSELLAWDSAGWRTAGRLQVKGTEHELACLLELDRDGQPDGPPRLRITSSWIIDSRWITRHWIPGLSRRIPMTCSFVLVPDM
jgi:polyisoprenoid-binding protein YceI